MSDEQILERLVALNAERAAEEKRGLIRWLRPEFQQARAGTVTADVEAAADGDDDAKRPTKGKRKTKGVADAEPKAKKGTTRAKKVAWPRTMADRARAVREVLNAVGSGTAGEIKGRFTKAKIENVTEILDTLATFGHARKDGAIYRSN